MELAHVDWPLIGALHELGFNQLSVAVPDLRADDGGTVEYFRSSARIRAVIEAACAALSLGEPDLGYGRSADPVELRPEAGFDHRARARSGHHVRLP